MLLKMDRKQISTIFILLIVLSMFQQRSYLMNQLKSVLLLLCLLALASSESCPWNHIGFSTIGIKSCEQRITFELTPIEGEYVQIPYNISNVNMTTPYNLSTMNVTIDNVSTIYHADTFHFHHKSKHIIDRQLYDFEMHLIHDNKLEASGTRSAGVAILFKAYPGNFPDPFDNWNLDTKVPVLQKFPIKLKTPSKSYHYEGLPGCTAAMMFFIDEDIIRIKQSSMRKVAKLIDDTNPPRGDENGSFIEAKDVCTVTSKNKQRKAIHHLGVN